MTDERAAVPTAIASDVHAHTGHHHLPAPRAPMSRRVLRLTLMVLIPAVALTTVAMVWLWPGPADREPWTGPPTVSGEAVSVDRAPCPATPEVPEAPIEIDVVCGTVNVRFTSGNDAGKQLAVEIPNGPGAPTVRAGDKLILIYVPDSLSGEPYQIIDHQRSTQLWLLVAAFALAVIAFGRWRGLSALAGLVVTFAVLLLFVVPAILDGKPPLAVAIVGSAAIMLVVLYLTHGLTVATSMAVLGTLTSLTLTGVLSAVATAVAKLNGVASEQSSFLTLTFPGVNMQGLLLAGILIGSLGVLDDVSVTQAYAVGELAQANPAMRFRTLYRAANRVGRAHIASVINTLVLAYAGASLPLLLLLAAGNQPLGEVVTGQFMAEEIVRAVVGTLGLIAAVPLTTALAALAATRTARAAQRTPAARRPAADRPKDGPPPQLRRHRRLDDLEAAWGLTDDDHGDGSYARTD